MKNKTLMLVATLMVAGTLPAIEVIKPEEKPAGCQAIGEIRVGDAFNRHSREIARQSLIDDAEQLRADKVSVQLIAHQHPKLGRDFTAVGVAWKCAK